MYQPYRHLTGLFPSQNLREALVCFFLVNPRRNVIVSRSNATFGIVLVRACVVILLLISPFLTVLATMLLAQRIARVGLLIVAVVEGLEMVSRRSLMVFIKS